MELLSDLFSSENSALLVAIGAFAIGLIFGYVIQRTNFCTMGSLSDILTFGDYRRFRAWLLAGAIAILGAQILRYLGIVDLSLSLYLGSSLNWFGSIVGGLIFGFGMAYAGGCTSRNLVRVGGGDLRSLIVLIIVGIFAYMTIGGILGPLRSEVQQITSIDLTNFNLSSQGTDVVFSSLFGLEQQVSSIIVTVIIAGPLLLYCFKDKNFRSSSVHVVAGIAIGLCVVLGWALTGFAFDEFADKPQNPASLTLVRPTGDTLEYLQRFTADIIPNFGVASVLGALAGAFLAAKLSGSFRLTTFSDLGDTLRNMFGAALMGFGGVMALGCTIGQGVTGLSTLAIGSILALISIILGGIAGIKHMESRI